MQNFFSTLAAVCLMHFACFNKTDYISVPYCFGRQFLPFDTEIRKRILIIFDLEKVHQKFL
jgi:hypothetical protein